MRREDAVRRELTHALGTDPGPITLHRAGGGCINSAAVVDVHGDTYFVKWNAQPLPGQFRAEAAGLRAMAASGTSLVIPKPIAFSDASPSEAFLALEHLPPGRRSPGFEVRLGVGLAEMHRCSSPQGFGFEVDGYCGATPQPNGWLPSWLSFYRERRLGHQIRLARQNGLASKHLRKLEALVAKLDELIDDDEAPALIHGDLWAGNLHVAPDGAPALIDPAAYFAHREAELGMMVMFGGFGERVFAAYDDAFPLRQGWRERLPLYTLYHVLNHFNLFGGGYGEQAGRIAQRFVG